MAWRAARSLLVLHQQLQAGAPRAKPPATAASAWGLIGDALHDPTSDHSPHDFPGWGNDIVTAGDFPNRPDLGLNARTVLDDIRRSHDARVKYAISNGEMFSSYPARGYDAWTWRPYTGSSDKHYTHGHLSVVGDSRSDGEQPWATIGAGMEQTDKVTGFQSKGNSVGDVLADVSNERDWWYVAPTTATKNPPPAGSRADLVLKAAQRVLEAEPATVELDTAAEERIAQRAAALVAEKLVALRFVADGAPAS
jgi:hypothetical protein